MLTDSIAGYVRADYMKRGAGVRAPTSISRVAAALGILLGVSCSAFADEVARPPQSIDELRQRIEAVLTETHTPAVSIAIVRSDGPEWVEALGLADVASRRPATARTLFRLGSMGKGPTAIAALILVNQGKLSLQDSVHRIAPEIPFTNPWETTDPLRVVHLLEHTSGWDGSSAIDVHQDLPNISFRDALNLRPGSLVSHWRPGTRFAYSNTNYGAAAFVIEKVSGEPFDDYVHRMVFKPIGMDTATYLHPARDTIVTNYEEDGRTPLPYWNFMYRSAGGFNASADDIAHYLQFYLHRGSVNGSEVLPSALVDRMETQTSTWAAKAGIKAGFGLGNYWSVVQSPDGKKRFVAHGHGGGIPGGLSEMAYLKEQGVGYFYAINSKNGAAFGKIGELIQEYVTRGLANPASEPPIGPLPSNASAYVGWYEPSSPRYMVEQFRLRFRNLGHVSVEEGKLQATTFNWRTYRLDTDVWLPVSGDLLRDSGDLFADIALLPKNSDGRFIQYGLQQTWQHIPTGFAVGELLLAGFVLVTTASSLVYAPFWLIAGLDSARRRPAERSIRAWPLIGSASFIGFLSLESNIGSLAADQLGTVTFLSLMVFLTTCLLPLAAAGSIVAWVRSSAGATRRRVRWHALAVTIALLVASIYLAYWGLFAVRTWE